MNKKYFIAAILFIITIGLFFWVNKRFIQNHGRNADLGAKLVDLAKKDNLEEIKNLLKHHPDSLEPCMLRMGCIMLQKAASANSFNTVKYLLTEEKIDVNCGDVSALCYASSMGRAEMVQYLLQNGAKIPPDGYRQLHPLHEAASANPDIWVVRDDKDFSKIDVLAVVKILVAYGADVNVTDNNGETPLHIAAFVHNYSIVKYLVEHGADVNARDKNGETPLHKAAFVHDFSIVQYLIEQKAEVNSQDNRGNSPLHKAVFFMDKSDGICTLLLNHGADPSLKNNDGKTPVLYSYQCLDMSTVQLFAKYGYDPVIDIDNEGNTLLHRALASDQFALIDYLLEHKADILTPTIYGTTPFHVAVRLRGNAGLNVIKKLLSSGVNINALDNSGHTPLYYISEVIYTDHGAYYPDTLIVNYLRKHGAHE